MGLDPSYGATHWIWMLVPTFMVWTIAGRSGLVAAKTDSTSEYQRLHPKMFLTLYLNLQVIPAVKSLITQRRSMLLELTPLRTTHDAPLEPLSHSKLQDTTGDPPVSTKSVMTVIHTMVWQVLVFTRSTVIGWGLIGRVQTSTPTSLSGEAFEDQPIELWTETLATISWPCGRLRGDCMNRLIGNMQQLLANTFASVPSQPSKSCTQVPSAALNSILY